MIAYAFGQAQVRKEHRVMFLSNLVHAHLARASLAWRTGPSEERTVKSPPILGSGRLRIDKERAKAFAAEFDPQPFHQAARRSIFCELSASGWTAAVTMRLLEIATGTRTDQRADNDAKPGRRGRVGLGCERSGAAPGLTRTIAARWETPG
jgi:hypothetical protein